MSILNKLGLKMIRYDKRSSIMTILSISMTVTMITAVMSLGFGSMNSMDEFIMQNTSQYNIEIEGDKEALQTLLHNLDANTLQHTTLRNWDYRYITHNSQSIISSVSHDDFWEIFPFLSQDTQHNFQLTAGRMPENDNEIVIVDVDSMLFPNLKLGDTLTTEMQFYNAETQEELIYSDQSVTVVGISETTQFSPHLPTAFSIPRTNPEALSLLETHQSLNNEAFLLIRFQDGTRNIRSLIAEAERGINSQLSFNYNDELNILLGMDYHLSPSKSAFLTLTLIVSLLIVIATFSLIYNTFSSTIDVRVKDYGMLRSLGATKKQLRHIIRIEGYTLSLLGIILGIVLGYGLGSVIAVTFTRTLVSVDITSSFIPTAMLPLPALIMTIIFSLIMVSIPLHQSIYKLFKLTSVEAVRESQRIQTPKRTFSLTTKNTPKKLAKIYAKRDTKRYRSIRIALIICMVLFVAIMSYVQQIFNLDGPHTNPDPSIIIGSDRGRYTDVTQQKQLQQIQQAIDNDPNHSRIRDYNFHISFSLNPLDDKNQPLQFTSELKNYLSNEGIELTDEEVENPKANLGAKAIIISDTAFQELAQTHKLDIKNSVRPIVIEHRVTNKKISDDAMHSFTGNIRAIHDQEHLRIRTSEEQASLPLTVFSIPMNSMPTSPLFIEKSEDLFDYYDTSIIMSETTFAEAQFNGDEIQNIRITFNLDTDNTSASYTHLNEQLGDDFYLYSESVEMQKIKIIINYLFVILLSMMIFITSVCVLNLVNISLIKFNIRRHELASLRSLGMTRNELRTMIIWESIYTLYNALISGTLISIAISYGFYTVVLNAGLGYDSNPVSIPAILIAISLILIVILVNIFTVLYESKKLSTIEDMRRL